MVYLITNEKYNLLDRVCATQLQNQSSQAFGLKTKSELYSLLCMGVNDKWTEDAQGWETSPQRHPPRPLKERCPCWGMTFLVCALDTLCLSDPSNWNRGKEVKDKKRR